MIEPDQVQDLQNRISQVQENIQAACKNSGREPADISLIAVAKKKTPVLVKTLVELGINNIGESYLQEALFKMELLQDQPINWHMIGPIQKGKEKRIAAAFSSVHSVTSVETARRLNKAAIAFDRVLPVYIELNISGEQNKYGWEAGNSEDWERILPDLEQILDLSGLNPAGLMTMAPYNTNPEASRPYFRQLREARDYFNGQLAGKSLDGLSMGMSGDYTVAVEEGATVLRIGSALVGPR